MCRSTSPDSRVATSTTGRPISATPRRLRLRRESSIVHPPLGINGTCPVPHHKASPGLKSVLWSEGQERKTVGLRVDSSECHSRWVHCWCACVKHVSCSRCLLLCRIQENAIYRERNGCQFSSDDFPTKLCKRRCCRLAAIIFHATI